MDGDQNDYNAFINTYYPNTIKEERADGSLSLNNSIFFKSVRSAQKSSVIVVGKFNTLCYRGHTQFIHFAGKDTVDDKQRVEDESRAILNEKNFYLFSKSGNSLKYFGVYSCKFIDDRPEVIDFFEKLERDTKAEEYKLNRILVLKKMPTAKELGLKIPINLKA